jgi:predicted transcriptional regulator
MLNILERKGKLKRSLKGRAFEYSAAVTEEKAATHAVRDLIDRMFAGSSEDLVMSLIKSRQIDADQIERLTRRLEEEGDER